MAGPVLPSGEGLAQGVGRDREAVDVDEVLDGILKGKAVVLVAVPVVTQVGEHLVLHGPLDAWALVATCHLLGWDPVPGGGVTLLGIVGGAWNQELEVALVDRSIARAAADSVEDLHADEGREREADGLELFAPILAPEILGEVVFYLYFRGHGSLIWFERCKDTKFCAPDQIFVQQNAKNRPFFGHPGIDCIF